MDTHRERPRYRTVFQIQDVCKDLGESLSGVDSIACLNFSGDACGLVSLLPSVYHSENDW